ncbi:hypothetical protein [Streptomyces orinoci]|uniref:Uncharacterized protein n=1 Tax=Streptomyces orinoci TaxID=67339 RepID=A0ABV3JZM0_STRON|nr:hypothetical protein [Streptomyces orinoci]
MRNSRLPEPPGPKGPQSQDDPLEHAVWRLRSRACWEDAAALLAPRAARDPRAARKRTAVLIERCLFTGEGWAAAEDALRSAEALAAGDEDRGAAACERGYLAYAATLLGVHDRADEARSALGRAAALLAPGSPRRPLLNFRRGLIAQHLSDNPSDATAAFQRAHDGASAHGHRLLLSFTWRHLAALAEHDGRLAEARHGYAQSLGLREELGYLVGIAPALVSLAGVLAEPAEADRLRREARRLMRLLGGVPSWLEEQLGAAEGATVNRRR